jgi:type VI secretion system ImpM family protein
VSAFVAEGTTLLGKAPFQAEFLRIPSSTPGFSAFDTWLTDATEWASARAGSEWPSAFASGAIHAFAFRPPGSPPDLLVCGALAPSHDRAGRQFPLAAAASIRASRGIVERPHLLPFALESFWTSATALLLEVLNRPDAVPTASSAHLVAEPDIAEQEAEELYDQWTRELEVSELCNLLELSSGDLAGILRLLNAAVSPFVDTEGPDTPLSLRVPLGLVGGVALCFWLNLLTRMLRWRSTIPSFFWSHDGQRGEALLHLGRPPKMTLAELWMPTGRYDPFCDLTRRPSPEVLQQTPEAPEVVSALAMPDAKVEHLMAALGRA